MTTFEKTGTSDENEVVTIDVTTSAFTESLTGQRASLTGERASLLSRPVERAELPLCERLSEACHFDTFALHTTL